jgi:hypothetical protein
MNIRRVHRVSATVVIAYAALHIANHLVGLAGVEAHRTTMEALRHLYRAPTVEMLLLASVAVQIATGLWLFIAGVRTRKGQMAWLQATSGLLLGTFMAIHVAAVLFGRHQLQLETNLYYAAAGMHVPQTRGFFVPYYFLGVLALFVHLGCALYRLRQRRRNDAHLPSAWKTVGGAAASGAVIALLLVLLLAGAIVPINVPAAYIATFDSFVR